MNFSCPLDDRRKKAARALARTEIRSRNFLSSDRGNERVWVKLSGNLRTFRDLSLLSFGLRRARLTRHGDVGEHRVKAINANDATAGPTRIVYVTTRLCGNDNNLLAPREDLFQIFISRKFPNVRPSSDNSETRSSSRDEWTRSSRSEQTSSRVTRDIDVGGTRRLSK